MHNLSQFWQTERTLSNLLACRFPERTLVAPSPPKHDHGACVADAVAAAEARVARLTPLRRRVLELICESHTPVGAYDLLGRLPGERRPAPPTVYRALDFLMQHGLVHRINSLNAYVGCFGPHRPHDACLFICERCRTVEESEALSVRRSIDQQAAARGFHVTGQTIEVTGLCRACAVAGI